MASIRKKKIHRSRAAAVDKSGRENAENVRRARREQKPAVAAGAETAVAVPVLDADAALLESVCDAIAGGASLREVQRANGFSVGGFYRWLKEKAERSTRVRDARAFSAWVYDDAAERLLTEARNFFELAKAKELASHYRWKASKIAPKQYGTQEVVDEAEEPVSEITVRFIDPTPINHDAIKQRMQARLQADPEPLPVAGG